MKFPYNETITYPFTAYYHGYLADLGESPSLDAYLYSVDDNKLLEIDAIVDLVETSQVSDDVLFVGTIYINKLENSIAVGEYRLKLSVRTSASTIELLYAPITIVENDHKFYVSFLGKETLLPEEVRYHLRNIVDPGIKTGFSISRSGSSWSYNIGPGVIYTKNGTVIEHGGTANAVHLQQTGGSPRIDAICVFYNPEQRDEEGSVTTPTFRVVKGLEDNNGLPPTIPPNYTVLRYASIPANAYSPTQIVLSDPRTKPGRRPFHRVPSIDSADGVKSRFSFNTDFIADTTVCHVDGIPQYISEGDYKEIKSTLNHSTIEFIGDVPQLGQTVTLSGQRLNGPFYDHDFSIYSSIAATPSEVSSYPRDGLIAEFTGANYIAGLWVSSEGTLTPFRSLVNMPLKGWDGDLLHYVYFDGTKVLDLEDAPSFNLDQFTIAIKLDVRDADTSSNWMRLIDKTGDITVYFINSFSEPSLIADYFGTRLTLQIPRWKVDLGPAVISITKDDANNVVLRYNDVMTSASIESGSKGSSAIRFGNAPIVNQGTGLQAKVKTILFYNRSLTSTELNTI